MPVLLLPTRTKTRFRWSRYFFFTLGMLLLLYVAFTLLATELYQDEQQREFEQAAAATANSGTAQKEGASLGRIEIKSLGLSAMIQEGVAEETLQRAVGHVPGTPLLGEHGNIALAAHRDTFFRRLRNIRLQDEILLTTTSGTTRYRVVFTQVVEPEETSVLQSSESDILTLVTCYPFNFVGTAPQRFIVRAHKVPS